MTWTDKKRKRDALARRCGKLLSDRGPDGWTEAAKKEFDAGVAELERLDIELTGMSMAAIDRITQDVVVALRSEEVSEDPQTALLAAVDAMIDKFGNSTTSEALADLADEVAAEIDFGGDDYEGPDRAVVEALLRRRS